MVFSNMMEDDLAFYIQYKPHYCRACIPTGDQYLTMPGSGKGYAGPACALES